MMKVVEKKFNIVNIWTETGSAPAVQCLVHALFLLHYDRIWGTCA